MMSQRCRYRPWWADGKTVHQDQICRAALQGGRFPLIQEPEDPGPYGRSPLLEAMKLYRLIQLQRHLDRMHDRFEEFYGFGVVKGTE